MTWHDVVNLIQRGWFMFIYKHAHGPKLQGLQMIPGRCLQSRFPKMAIAIIGVFDMSLPSSKCEAALERKPFTSLIEPAD